MGTGASQMEHGGWGGGLLEVCFCFSQSRHGHTGLSTLGNSDLWASILRSEIRILGLKGAEKTDGDPNL